MSPADFGITRKRFESLISPNTLWLVQRLINTNQAKNGLVIFIEKTLGCDQLTALRFYKEYANEQQANSGQASGCNQGP